MRDSPRNRQQVIETSTKKGKCKLQRCTRASHEDPLLDVLTRNNPHRDDTALIVRGANHNTQNAPASSQSPTSPKPTMFLQKGQKGQMSPLTLPENSCAAVKLPRNPAIQLPAREINASTSSLVYASTSIPTGCTPGPHSLVVFGSTNPSR